MHSIKSNFDKILAALREILAGDADIFKKRVRPGPRIMFTDLEVIALACTAECMGYDSENYFFSLLSKNDFPNLLSRRQYNDRRRRLQDQLEQVRQSVVSRMKPKQEAYVVDSMPLRLCRFSRKHWVRIGQQEHPIKPNIGYCAAQEEYYFGFKLHAVCTIEGALKFFDVSQASGADVDYLATINKKLKNAHLIGDKGYISQSFKEMLREESKVHLFTDSRKNAKKLTMIPSIYKGKRKRIETLFSQLTDQFNIQQNYAKTLVAYFTRIWSKLLAMTVLNYIQYVNYRPISQIKYALRF